MVNEKLQGNRLQTEQVKGFYLGRKHSRLMCGNASCSALPSHGVAVLWILLSFIQSFPKVSSDENSSSSFGRQIVL